MSLSIYLLGAFILYVVIFFSLIKLKKKQPQYTADIAGDGNNNKDNAFEDGFNVGYEETHPQDLEAAKTKLVALFRNIQAMQEEKVLESQFKRYQTNRSGSEDSSEGSDSMVNGIFNKFGGAQDDKEDPEENTDGGTEKSLENTGGEEVMSATSDQEVEQVQQKEQQNESINKLKTEVKIKLKKG